MGAQPQIRLSAFEGPLDLLIHLIEKNKINIYDIPIAQLTDQYLAFLEETDAADMENLSAFLVMAAELLEMKSRMLLPKPEPPEEEEDPREKLVARLLEYKRYKTAAQALAQSRAEAEKRLFRPGDRGLVFETEPVTGAEALEGVTWDALYQAFAQVLSRKEATRDPVRSQFSTVVRDTFTVAQKTALLRELLRVTPRLLFADLFPETAGREEVIVTFLALLDLIKAGEAQARQDVTFGEIVITGGHVPPGEGRLDSQEESGPEGAGREGEET